jgi:hypothetical protein
MERNEIPHDPRHLGVPSGVSKMISKPMVRLAQTAHLAWTDTNTVFKRTKTIVLDIGVSKNIGGGR